MADFLGSAGDQGRVRGRGRPWFQSAAAHFCVRRRQRGWAGRPARPLNQVAQRRRGEPGQVNRDRKRLWRELPVRAVERAGRVRHRHLLWDQFHRIVCSASCGRKKKSAAETESRSSLMRSRMSGVTARSFSVARDRRPAFSEELGLREELSCSTGRARICSALSHWALGSERSQYQKELKAVFRRAPGLCSR